MVLRKPQPLTSKKVLARLLCLAIAVFLLRQEEWKTTFKINQVLLAINQHPIWQGVFNGPLPIAASASIFRNEQLLTNPTVARGWGLLLFQSGNETEAISIWQNADLSPGKVMANQGHYAKSTNDFHTAIIWFGNSVRLAPMLASSWHELGELNTQLGHFADAKTAYAQGISLQNSASVNPLAILWRDEGNHANAIEVWQSALNSFSADPNRLLWWQGLTISLRATEQWERGRETVELAIQEFPRDARLYVEKGAIIYGFNSDASVAMDAINTAITFDSTVITAYSTAASIMAGEKQYMTAYDWYTEAINRNDHVSSWYVARGHMARAAGNLPLALESFIAAIERFPNNAPAHFGIAQVYQQLDQRENAFRAIERALEADGLVNVQAYLLAAEIYEWNDSINEAVTLYRQVLLIDPENIVAKQAIQRLQNK